ncbi:helix-turn-helix domain-containing protein [Paenibacillus fonticola]|uniref:helix-turn-helix domain-containing protein n=1 Tax=Paenibacillus fonticola TaxID=379896 RepID=UPI00036B79BF|nr:helix-turn-helix transcriptional regulator [Paenibacillus fonticola]
MNKQELKHSRTVLEYLVMINELSYSGIGRELNITPQQFSDWIKKRRPIPQERLQALAQYFGVEETVLVDNHQYTKPLTTLAKIELHILLIEQKVAQLEAEGADEEDIEPYRQSKVKLQRERTDELRLARVAAVLQQGDERTDAIIDFVLNELETGRLEDLSRKLQKGEGPK